MTSTDFSAREPHQQIIEYLEPREFDGDCPTLPANGLTARYYIDWPHVAEGFSKEEAEAALDELIDADIVIERSDAHTGERMVGLREYVEKADAPYEKTKGDVYRKAKARGLWPKWRPGEGWRLVNGGGKTVVEGPMEDLNEYLDRTPA